MLETVGECSTREAREAAAAALKATQTLGEVGKRMALHEAAMVGDLKRLSKEVVKAA